MTDPTPATVAAAVTGLTEADIYLRAARIYVKYARAWRRQYTTPEEQAAFLEAEARATATDPWLHRLVDSVTPDGEWRDEWGWRHPDAGPYIDTTLNETDARNVVARYSTDLRPLLLCHRRVWYGPIETVTEETG